MSKVTIWYEKNTFHRNFSDDLGIKFINCGKAVGFK